MTDLQAPDLRVTFDNATPETHDVVLCKYCGGTLHAPEDDIFWEMTTGHRCKKMLEERIEELEAERDKLAVEVEHLRVYRYRAGVADDKLERISAKNCILERKFGQALASVGAVIEKAAEAIEWKYNHATIVDGRDVITWAHDEVRALNPDAQAALNEMLADTWKEAYAQGWDDFACNKESKNPYEK